MSVLQASSTRLASRCIFCRSLSLPIRAKNQSRLLSSSTRRNADEDKSGGDSPAPSNPILEEYRKQNPQQPQEARQQQQQRPQAGDLSASSIFEEDRRVQKQAEREVSGDEGGDVQVGKQKRDPRSMLRVLDPDPASRERWERKKVIQMVRRGGRLKKAQFIRRTERQHLVRSHNMKTSVKKLGMLARQIAGKNIDDAITQMQYSKKKVAIEVRKQLEVARDEAVVMRGMGLGKVNRDEDAANLNDTSAVVTGTTTPDAETKKADEPIHIRLKDGKRHIIEDRSKIYVDQAWVGRGPYGKLPDYRAKGRINIMRTPFTSLSVLLKEEATRIREYKDREAKRTRQRLGKVWTALPDRPIINERQWYSW